ncbi:ABC transporter permease [Natrarchaeobius sp. A-rgal3]|uniref:ABC transporter permease n=1 Tax=Natrarchaeobius versutus TaxID=1679078 RepID=UPI00351068E0
MLQYITQAINSSKAVPGRVVPDNVIDTIERFSERYGTNLGLGMSALVLLFLWIPLIVVTFMSFADSVHFFPPNELTLEWYRDFISDPRAREATMTSIRVSVIAVPVSVLFATLAAYGIERYSFRGKALLMLLLVLPIIVPLVVTGAALMQFLHTIGIGSGFWSVVIAHIVRCVPFATLAILPSFYMFDNSLEEASLDLGANELQTFVRVTLPNVLPGLIAGTLLSFAISFNEFTYTLFNQDTQTTTLPIYIWNEISHGVTPIINVISVLLIGVALFAVALAVGATSTERIITRGRSGTTDE